MKKSHHIFLIAGVVLGVFVLLEIYRAYAAGIRDFKSFLKWISNSGASVAGAVSDVVSNAQAAASIPSLVAQGQALDTQITNQNYTDYAPGGRIYNNILASQGQAAADAAWAQVQADDASMTAQTGTWYNPFSW